MLLGALAPSEKDREHDPPGFSVFDLTNCTLAEVVAEFGGGDGYVPFYFLASDLRRLGHIEGRQMLDVCHTPRNVGSPPQSAADKAHCDVFGLQRPSGAARLPFESMKLDVVAAFRIEP